MTDGVLPLQLVVDRIEDGATIFREIGGAGDFARMLETSANWPGAWVLPARDRAGENQYSYGKVGHRVTSQFAVMILARSIATSDGIAGLTELDACRAELHTKLLNWEPGEAFEATTYVGGELVSDIGQDGLLVWQSLYQTAHQLEST